MRWSDVLTRLDPANVRYTPRALGRVRTRHAPPVNPFQGGAPTGEMDDRLRQALSAVKGDVDDDGGFDPLGAVFGASREAFTTALELIDKPGAMTRAGLDELMGVLNSDYADDEGWWDKVQRGAPASEMEWVKDVAGIKSQDPAFLGLGIEIGADPLNFVAPQMALDDVADVGRRLTTEGVEHLGREGA